MTVNDAAILRHAATGRSRGRSAADAVARRVVVEAASRGTGGVIELTEGSRTRCLGSGDLSARVTVSDAAAFSAILRSGSVGLGASYVAGWWECDDLTTLVRILYRFTHPMRARLDRLGRAWAGVIDLPTRLFPPGPDDDKRNVSDHYDLSNDFFALMLDPTMTYSCAVFDPPGSDLLDAQITKIDRLCAKLELTAGEHLVEIGSGWGGLAVHAARHYGVRVTTTTVSDAQRAYVEKRVAEAGLTDRITVRGDDWRDLRGRYDKLVSVEMIEAVDWRHHDQFLAACSDLLTDGGRAAIQAIVIDDRSFERAKRHQDFVRRMVFPGGCLPSVASLTASLARSTDFRLAGLEDIGGYYPQTLRSWAENLHRHADGVQALKVGEEFLRLWALYLAYCEASFTEGHISVVHLVLDRPGRAGAGQPPAAPSPSEVITSTS